MDKSDITWRLDEVERTDQGIKFEKRIILDIVPLIRKKRGIRPTREYKQEISCFAVGQGYNLLYRQLATTEEGYGSWESELDWGPSRRLVLQQIRKDLDKIFD